MLKIKLLMFYAFKETNGAEIIKAVITGLYFKHLYLIPVNCFKFNYRTFDF